MANTPISGLNNGLAAEPDDQIPIAREGANYYITNSYIKSYVLSATNVFTGSNTFSGSFFLGTSGSVSGKINFYNSTNANVVGLQSGATSSSITYTLPSSSPASGQVLSSDSSGNLSWITTGSGGISPGVSGQISYYTSSGTTLSGSGAYWDSINSRFGVGTSLPSYAYEFFSNSVSYLVVSGNSNTNIVSNRFSNDALSPVIAGYKARGTRASPDIVVSGDKILSLSSQVADNIPSTWPVVAEIATFVDTYTSASDISSYMTFSTSPDGGLSSTERMRITKEGNLGVGTTSPYSVAGSTSVTIDGSFGGGVLDIRKSGSSIIQVGSDGTSSGALIDAIAGGPLRFAVSSSTKVAINSDGNVGIGTVSPTSLSGYTVVSIDNSTNGGLLDIRNNGVSVGRLSQGSSSSDFFVDAVGGGYLGLAINGNPKMVVSYTGNVGVGTTTPTSVSNYTFLTIDNTDAGASSNGGILEIKKNGSNIGRIGWAATGADFMINANGASGSLVLATGGSAKAVVTSAGNFGVGTTAPAYAAEFYRASASFLTVSGDAATGVISNRFSNDASPPRLASWKARGTRAVPAAVQSGDQVTSLISQVANSATPTWPAIAEISTFVDTFTSSSDISSYMTFSTSPSGGTASTERMRIDKSGNVGIDTGSSMTSIAGYTTLTINNATNGGLIEFRRGGISFGRIGYDVGTGGFMVNSNGGGAVELAIGGVPKLLVGTSGDVTLTNNLVFSGTTYTTTIKPSASATANWSMTIPVDGGTNGYYLQTDGTGVTSWQPISISVISGILPSANGGTGINNGSSTITIGGNITFSGAHTFGATLTGNTSVTFPTSGTLVTTSNTVASFSAGTTGFTPNTATTGAITLAGTLNVSNGGTGSTSFTSGSIPYSDGTIITQNNSSLFWDNTNVRLGIGTNTPFSGSAFSSIPNLQGIQVSTPGGTNRALLAATGEGSTTVMAARYSANASPGRFAGWKARGTIASPAAVQSGDQVLSVIAQAAESSTPSYSIVGEVGIYVDTFSSSTDISSYMTFSTSPDGGTASTERMRIDKSGNVIIGAAGTAAGSSATRTLVLNTGTAPTTGSSSTVQIYSSAISAGNTIPSIYTEGSGVTGAGITNTTVTTKIAVRINGTVYYLLATTNGT